MHAGAVAGMTAGGAGAPPTAGEGLLYEAVARGDEAAVIDVLSRVRLYFLVPRLHADTPGFIPRPAPHRDDATRRTVIPVLTEGMLPAWHPEWVFQQTTLDRIAQSWPDSKWRLAVNQDTPYATTLRARPADRQKWLAAAARSDGPAGVRLLTHGGGHLLGPLAHGLALGAHLAVLNGLVWNTLGAAYEDYGTDRARLRRPWGVTHRAGYRETLDSLIATKLVGRVPESLLRARRTLAVRLGRAPTHDEWSRSVAEGLSRHGASGESVREAGEFLRRIAHYEQRFRADGVLPPEGRVDTLAAFDHGRAVNVVRLALGARLCDPAEAEQAVLRIGEAARPLYGSWEEFSLGYVLTRLIHFDEGDPEEMYRESLAIHHALTHDPASPYRNIPWS
ncbi:DUF1266 domain-containing protein [Streptomyces purpureus]|uniref:DUF1266 domain-containing protein n=1 Tax=Streptomyces purpureus TaxID=1951 RepID=UPI00059271FA|nr:DUF1266 domain-containing protein [Streptomyces purpureus]